MFSDKDKLVKTDAIMLKQQVTSFLIQYRKNYKAFPISDINKLSRHNSIKKVSNMIIDGKSIEPAIAIKLIKDRYRKIAKKTNPGYFSSVIRGFLNDSRKTKTIDDVKELYKNYDTELKSIFKEMDLDLKYCVNGLKSINKSLKDYNKKGNEK